MPLYDYSCKKCGTFALRREVEDRNLPARCPECHATAGREISAPNLSLMAPQRRVAHARNEKSRHEPMVTGTHSCSSGCGCGRGAGKPLSRNKRTVDAGGLGRLQTSARKSARPWMLGH